MGFANGRLGAGGRGRAGGRGLVVDVVWVREWGWRPRRVSGPRTAL